MVGAGAGGLAVAARLAAKRHSVTVVESLDRTGGKLHTLRRDGYAFDTGPSLFTLPAVYRDLFLKTGKALEDEVDLQPVDPGFEYLFADGTRLGLPGVGVGAVAEAMQETLGGTAGSDWLALMRRAGRMWALTRTDVLSRPIEGVRSLARLARDPRDVRTIAPHRSLRSLGRHYLRDPRQRQLLDRYATYTGSDPRRAPAVLATIPYMEATFGAWHIAGGLGVLADAMTRRCEQLGVDFRLGTTVTRVLTEREGSSGTGAVRGVRLADDTDLAADIVIADVDARHLYVDLLPGGEARDEERRLRRSDRSLSGVVLLLALAGRSDDPRHHRVLFTGDYDAEFDAIFGRRGRRPMPVEDPTVYICHPQDDLMNPPDGESWFLLVNAPIQATDGSGVDWRGSGPAQEYADRVLATLATRGLDIRDRIRWREVLTPADLADSYGDVGGSLYGTASHGASATMLRPRNRSPLPGLYLVGGSTHPGGGLPMVGLSAEIVADLIGRA